MRVLVVGAGIAGLSAALRLTQLGIRPTVVEQAADPRGGGYMVDFFGPGVAAAERLGLRPQLERVHDPVERLTFVDGRGRQRFAVDYPLLRRRLFAGQHFNFLRGDLEGVLLDALPDGTDVRYGQQIGQVASVANGSTDDWDVVIAADGAHSALRRSVLRPGGTAYRDLHHVVAAWMLDEPPRGVTAGQFTTLTAPGRMVAVYPVHGRRTATFFLHRTPAVAEDLAAGPVATLHRGYGDLGWVVPDLLATLPSAAEPYFDATVQVRTTTWHRGRVALVGDAAWCVSLLAGQGASLAVAGGVALAEELAAAPRDLPGALARYERRLRPLVERRAAAGARTAAWFVPEQRWRAAVRDVSVRAGAWPLAGRLVGGRLGVGRAAA